MKKVLIIDDAPEVRALITEVLKLNGYQTLVAEDGQAGVDLARRHVPDLILCDVKMPRMDGFATLTAIRENGGTAGIPFIFLTGIADKPRIRQGMELGADDYLTKPFTIQELVAAVRTRLEKQAVLVRQAEKKLNDLRGNISLALPHELLTPLTAVLGFSSALVEHHATLSSAEVVEFANSIHQSALRLQRLCENMLVYSQIELAFTDAEKVALIREGIWAVDVEGLGARAKKIAQSLQREGDLTVQLTPALASIASDKLEKVICELLDNAFKFSRPGDPVILSSHCEQNNCVIRVADRGRGMSAEQIFSIGAHMQFERQLYEQQGAGLGLSIAKRLTELHGGDLRIESSPGEGATVQVTFPRR